VIDAEQIEVNESWVELYQGDEFSDEITIMYMDGVRRRKVRFEELTKFMSDRLEFTVF